MTIQDTIPKWIGDDAKWLNERKLIRDGKSVVCIDCDYIMFSSNKPDPGDRYYFRIKLKQKQ